MILRQLGLCHLRSNDKQDLGKEILAYMMEAQDPSVRTRESIIGLQIFDLKILQANFASFTEVIDAAIEAKYVSTLAMLMIHSSSLDATSTHYRS